MNPNFLNLFMKKLTRERVAPIISARVTHFNSEVIDSFDLSRDGKRLVMSRGTVKQDVVLIHDLR
jgi:hypothetical protein